MPQELISRVIYGEQNTDLVSSVLNLACRPWIRLNTSNWSVVCFTDQTTASCSRRQFTVVTLRRLVSNLEEVSSCIDVKSGWTGVRASCDSRQVIHAPVMQSDIGIPLLMWKWLAIADGQTIVLRELSHVTQTIVTSWGKWMSLCMVVVCNEEVQLLNGMS